MGAETCAEASKNIPIGETTITRRQLLVFVVGASAASAVPVFAQEKGETSEIVTILADANNLAKKQVEIWRKQKRLPENFTHITNSNLAVFFQELAEALQSTHADFAVKLRTYAATLARQNSAEEKVIAGQTYNAFFLDSGISIMPNGMMYEKEKLFWQVEKSEIPAAVQTPIHSFFTSNEIEKAGSMSVFTAREKNTGQRGFTDRYGNIIANLDPGDFERSIPSSWKLTGQQEADSTLANEYIQALVMKGMGFPVDGVSMQISKNIMPDGTVDGVNMWEYISDAGSLSVNPSHLSNLVRNFLREIHIQQDNSIDFDNATFKMPSYELSTRTFLLNLKNLPHYQEIQRLVVEYLPLRTYYRQQADAGTLTPQMEEEWDRLVNEKIRSVLSLLDERDINSIRADYAEGAKIFLDVIRKSFPQ